MVASNIRLPNIRRMFVPDPGRIIIDADLSGADAQVVAWEADDEDLKSAFRQGLKIHIHNARAMFGHEVKDMTNDDIKHSPIYKAVKRGVHAVNYGASENSLVASNGWTKKFAAEFRYRWFQIHPKIKDWHDRVEAHLQGTRCWNCDEFENITPGRPCPSCGKHLGRTVKNAFGFRIIFFERPDSILPKALAWAPQSTVAFCTEIGWTAMGSKTGASFATQLSHSGFRVYNWENLLVNPRLSEKWRGKVEFLIQVHDSIVFQLLGKHDRRTDKMLIKNVAEIPARYEDNLQEIIDGLLVRVPYKDPLVIPMGYGASDKSWGNIE